MAKSLLFVVQLVNLFLRVAKSHKNCPDGVCDDPLVKSGRLRANLSSPPGAVGFFFLDIFSFLRCFPMERVVAVAKRMFALVKTCDFCPDGDCSIFDLLSCIDLPEAVDIAREILSIIEDAKICDDDSDGEITLGAAISDA